MADAVISARGVGKRFLIHHQRATSLKERFLQTRRSKAEEFWALRDIDLDIHGGETVGLIGANGSGKSTLLKLLAGILEPTVGSVRVRGRVASLLELGAGFNGELTGRENIYLNASILGLTRREINRNFDSIVEFSGLEQFIDNQVKHYSSGQYVRLGFAIAVHVDPDVLLVDEVLAVGDEAFQAKCLAKITEFQERGCTILFVTHAVDLVPRLCSRGLVLDHGRVLHDGDALEAAERLRTLLGTAPDQSGGAGRSQGRVPGGRATGRRGRRRGRRRATAGGGGPRGRDRPGGRADVGDGRRGGALRAERHLDRPLLRQGAAADPGDLRPGGRPARAGGPRTGRSPLQRGPAGDRLQRARPGRRRLDHRANRGGGTCRAQRQPATPRRWRPWSSLATTASTWSLPAWRHWPHRTCPRAGCRSGWSTTPPPTGPRS